MTRNFRLSCYPSHAKKEKRNKTKKWREIFSYPFQTGPVPPKKEKRNIVTRNFWLLIWKSDPACHYFLVIFYNHPARSIVDLEKKRNKTKKWREIFSCLIRADPNQAKKRKRKKNEIVTRNIWLSFLKSDQVCLYFLVTLYSYPALSFVDQEREKQDSDEKYSAVFIRTDPREKGSESKSGKLFERRNVL